MGSATAIVGKFHAVLTILTPGKKKPAPKRGFLFHFLRAMGQPRSCSSALLKVALGRMALLALATSGR